MIGKKLLSGIMIFTIAILLVSFQPAHALITDPSGLSVTAPFDTFLVNDLDISWTTASTDNNIIDGVLLGHSILIDTGVSFVTAFEILITTSSSFGTTIKIPLVADSTNGVFIFDDLGDPFLNDEVLILTPNTAFAVNVVGVFDDPINPTGDILLATTFSGSVDNLPSGTATHADSDLPVITLVGATPLTLEVGFDTYNEQGAVATDNDLFFDGTVTIGGDEVLDLVNQYIVTYNAVDPSGNNAVEVTRTVIVQDTTLPVITGSTIVDPIQLSLVNLYPEFCTSTDNDPAYVGICVTNSGSIDTSILGFQIITYSANADASGNTPTNVNISTNVQDTILPTIALNGDSTIFLIKGIDTYVELGATVTDNNKFLNGDPAIVGGDTVLDLLGEYIVTYNITDPSDNVAEQITRTVFVISGDFPTITLIGASPITLEVGFDTYLEQGATCNDVEDGSIEVDIGGDVVDTSLVDTYTVTYDCADSSMNNAEQVQRTIIVQDTTPPTITLNIEPPFDANVVLIKGFDEYIEVGATISDNNKFLNGDSVSDIDNFINENAIGVYIVTYNAVDPSGNVAEQVIRIVSIVEGNAPVITILGDNPVTVPFGSVYVDAGATCIDEEDGDLTEIFYEETSENGDMVFNVGLEDDSDLIDTSILDPQTVTYTCTDASMNVILAVRDVEIQKKGGGGGASKHLTRPTFGVDHAMGSIQTVSNAISLNGFIINIDDNYYTEVPLQTLKVGQENKWSAKVYAERGLKSISFLIGLPEIGMANYAESEIIVEFNSDGTKKSVEVIQKDGIVNKDSVRVNTWNTTCTPNDAVAKCKSVSIGFKLNQSPLNKVFANQAIDFKLRQQTTSFNEGFEVLGNSLNPAPVFNVAQNGIIHDLTWIDPTFLDRTIAMDENGDLWQLQGTISSFWKKTTQTEIIHCSDNNKAWEIRGCPEFKSLMQGQELLAMQYYPYLYSDISFEEINNIFAYEYPDRDNNRLDNTQLD